MHNFLKRVFGDSLLSVVEQSPEEVTLEGRLLPFLAGPLSSFFLSSLLLLPMVTLLVFWDLACELDASGLVWFFAIPALLGILYFSWVTYFSFVMIRSFGDMVVDLKSRVVRHKPRWFSKKVKHEVSFSNIKSIACFPMDRKKESDWTVLIIHGEDDPLGCGSSVTKEKANSLALLLSELTGAPIDRDFKWPDESETPPTKEEDHKEEADSQKAFDTGWLMMGIVCVIIAAAFLICTISSC